MEVGVSVDEVKVSSQLLHQIHLKIQGSKKHKYLQDKNDSNDVTWNSIDWKGLKSGFLSLSPLKWIKTSKSRHKWLNMGCQKSKISPDATDSHKCPRCHEPNKTQDHILKCHYFGAHKKWYDLVYPLIKIWQNNICPTQAVFTKFIRSWLESLETIILDVSSVHVSQRELTWNAIADQEQIGWHMAMKVISATTGD